MIIEQKFIRYTVSLSGKKYRMLESQKQFILRSESGQELTDAADSPPQNIWVMVSNLKLFLAYLKVNVIHKT